MKTFIYISIPLLFLIFINFINSCGNEIDELLLGNGNRNGNGNGNRNRNGNGNGNRNRNGNGNGETPYIKIEAYVEEEVFVTEDADGTETVVNILSSKIGGGTYATDKTYSEFLKSGVLKKAFNIKIANSTGGLIRIDPVEENKEYNGFNDFKTPRTVCNVGGFCTENLAWENSQTEPNESVELRTDTARTIVSIWITRGLPTIEIANKNYSIGIVCTSVLKKHIKKFADGISKLELIAAGRAHLSFEGGENSICKMGFWSDDKAATPIPENWAENAIAQKEEVSFSLVVGALVTNDYANNSSTLSAMGFSMRQSMSERNDVGFQTKVLEKMIDNKEKFPSLVKKIKINIVDILPEPEIPEGSIILHGS